MKKILFACLAMSACTDQLISTTTRGGTPTVIEPAPNVAVTQGRADQLAIGDLCADLARTRGTNGMAQDLAILRRSADFTTNEFALISRGEVAVGMSQRAAICALGGNSNTVKSVKSTTSTGHIREEMLFNGSPGVTLYTDNYVVTGIKM